VLVVNETEASAVAAHLGMSAAEPTEDAQPPRPLGDAPRRHPHRFPRA
jgi:hypothetical protein